jgi:uncharacterized membrane protein
MHPLFQRNLQIVTGVLLVVSFLVAFFIKRSTPDTTEKDSAYYALTVGAIVSVVTVIVGTLISIVSEKRANDHRSKKNAANAAKAAKANAESEKAANHNIINWVANAKITPVAGKWF